MPVYFEFSGFNDACAEHIADQIAAALKGIEFSTILIGCHFGRKTEEENLELLHNFRILTAKKAIEKIGCDADFENPEVNILIDFNQNLIDFHIFPVYFSGRYNKFARNIAQTKHYCRFCKGRGCRECHQTGKTTQDSVEELIAESALPEFSADAGIMHGAGREDVDVLMLGTGRTFVFEVKNPKKRKIDLKKLQNSINSKFKNKIAVSNLEFCGRELVAKIKSLPHHKIYLAKIECSAKPDLKLLKNKLGIKFDIEQRTPERVEKRRADMVRKKDAIILEIKSLLDKELELKINASDGLYIKEFVSGDNKRTNPSISGLLGIDCICSQLDVLEILDE